MLAHTHFCIRHTSTHTHTLTFVCTHLYDKHIWAHIHTCTHMWICVHGYLHTHISMSDTHQHTTNDTCVDFCCSLFDCVAKNNKVEQTATEVNTSVIGSVLMCVWYRNVYIRHTSAQFNMCVHIFTWQAHMNTHTHVNLCVHTFVWQTHMRTHTYLHAHVHRRE